MEGRVFALKQRIEHGLVQNWTVEEMAQSSNLSVSHFHKLWRNEMGIPPAAYLKVRRLEKAKHLIETTFEPIKRIGFLVGFSDGSNFTRNFKRRFGVVPSEYRKNYWNSKSEYRSDDSV